MYLKEGISSQDLFGYKLTGNPHKLILNGKKVYYLTVSKIEFSPKSSSHITPIITWVFGHLE